MLNHLADRGRKKRSLLYLTIVAWTSNFFCYFCNTLDVSSSKNEAGTSKVNISINRRRRRSQTVWPTKIKKWPLFGFSLSVETSNFIYKAFDKYSLKIKWLYYRQVFFLLENGTVRPTKIIKVAVIAYLSRLAVVRVVRTVPSVLYNKL